MNFISVIIIFASFFISKAHNCIKTRCRFIQTNVRPNWKIIDHNNEFSHHPTQFTTHKSDGEICVSFISSPGIDQNIFNKMTDYFAIDLSGNEIKTIEKTYFVLLNQLETLNLNENLIQSFPMNVFDDLTNLRKITMRTNLIEFLDGDLFAFNHHLEIIDFSYNKIARVSPQTFNHLNAPKIISLRGNLCIDIIFPEVDWEKFKSDVAAMCSDRNIVAFIVNLMKISKQANNNTIFETVKLEKEDNSTGFEITSVIKKSSSSTRLETPSELDVLLTSLFWLIVPVILILSIILGLICFAIYNKYFNYSLAYSRRQT